MEEEQAKITCPVCAKRIPAIAPQCRYCGTWRKKDVSAAALSTQQPPASPVKGRSRIGIIIGLSSFAVICVLSISYIALYNNTSATGASNLQSEEAAALAAHAPRTDVKKTNPGKDKAKSPTESSHIAATFSSERQAAFHACFSIAVTFIRPRLETDPLTISAEQAALFIFGEYILPDLLDTKSRLPRVAEAPSSMTKVLLYLVYGTSEPDRSAVVNDIKEQVAANRNVLERLFERELATRTTNCESTGRKRLGRCRFEDATPALSWALDLHLYERRNGASDACIARGGAWQSR